MIRHPPLNLYPPLEETIWGAARDIRSGRRTCVEVLEGCLHRIEQWEELVRAWVRVDREGARARAHELDERQPRETDPGPLYGIPVAIKDIVDVAGMPTTAGSPLFADRMAGQDAPIVARLRAAGAVILGKTVTTQFASFDPPVTRNPWNPARTPGGSSSGSAAALACGMCLGAIGSQTGGSITRPASFCGVAGLKPTHGLVDAEGVLPLAPSMDHPGPMARTVRDLAILLDVLVGSGDTAIRAGQPISPSLAQALEDGPLPAPRIGRLRGLFDERADQAVREAFSRATRLLAAAGAVVHEPTLPPGFDDVLEKHRVVMAVEAAAWHEPLFAGHRNEYLPRIRELVEEGLAARAPVYARALQNQATLRRDVLRCFAAADVLATPATTTPAPDISSTGDPAFNSPWSYVGLPTVSLPICTSPDGLPLAIQLVGRPFAEADLLRAAAWCEAVIRCELGAPEPLAEQGQGEG